MRMIGKFLGRLLALLLLVAVAMWLLGPYEKIDLKASFEPQKLDQGVQAYFEAVEAQVSGITPGTEKRVIWQPGSEERRTAFSVLYVHGFSATSQEIRPVPDMIADALGANLVYTRLEGHGQGGAELAAASPSVWMMDLAEGLAAARAVGERVVVISTSTGGTLVAAAALDSDMSASVAAMIFVSPNFGVNNDMAFLMTWPAARYWLPLVLGGERTSPSDNPDKEKYWTRTYPWSALPPMGTLVKIVASLDFSTAKTPALFWFTEGDKVVRPDKTRAVAEAWGGAATINIVTVGPGDDPSSHVIAGDIRSPSQTAPAVTGMLAWLAQLGIE